MLKLPSFGSSAIWNLCLQVLAARAIGEGAEHLWSLMLGTAKSTRYMALANRQDCLDDGLYLIAQFKQGEFCVQFVARLKRTKAILGKVYCIQSRYNIGVLSRLA